MPESRHRRRRGRTASPRGRRTPTPRAGAPPRRRRKTNYLYLAASAIIAVLVIAGFAVGDIANFGASTSSTGSSDDYVEGVGVQQHLMPTAHHIPEGQTVTNYSTTPPTSGDHWAIPASCGFYEEGLPDERIVHNLEHGNIVVSYNLETEEQVQQLREAIDNIGLSRVWGITRFYSQIEPGTVAVAAWGVLDTMQGVDADRIKRFYETYAGNLGPEQIVC